MIDLFIHSYDDCFIIEHTVHSDVVYCVDIHSFIESCAAGHACAMSICVFQHGFTDYKLSLIDSRYANLISIDDFYSRLVLLNSIYNTLEVY